jgi:ubiquinone/menaquinone biosynthesis C-methylase UbiE
MSLFWSRLLFHRLMPHPVKLFERINNLGWYKNTLRTWVDDLELVANVHILELGCATGALTEYMASRGYEATGIDASDTMISAALSGEGRRARYQTGDAKSLGIADASFDAVISASLLNIISEPEKVMHEMKRVCKPGGLVSILVPKQGFSDAQHVELTKSIRATGFSAAALSTWHKRAPKLNPKTAISWFEQAGMSNIRGKEYLGAMVITVTGVKL